MSIEGNIGMDKVKTGNILSKFRADLHIHTVLSPCADLQMSPANIIKKAKESGLQLIGITDHNSTKNALLTKELGNQQGILVLTGVEITTREEVHCLAFFEKKEQLHEFQKYLDNNIVKIPNPDGHFGYQPVLDKDENIRELVPYYLTAALNKDIEHVQRRVFELDGIFIPAHVDRQMNGIFSQLGFIPPKLKYHALGISGRAQEKDVRKHYVLQKKITLIRNSDAHYLNQIGEIYSEFFMRDLCFEEVKKALGQEDSRKVRIV